MAPAMSWSSTLRVSRTDPPPLRITIGSTPSPTRTRSWAHNSFKYGPSTSGGTSRNG